MKSFLATSFLFSAAVAWPYEVPPRQTAVPTRVQERAEPIVAAIIPTASGQIGINPVLVNPVETGGPYNSFFSDYVDDKGKWKPKDTEHITQVQVTTKDGKPTTSTVTAPVAVVTGPDGDLEVLMAPKLQDKLGDMMKSVPQCSKKRDAACGIVKFLEDFKADDSALIESLEDAVQGIKFLSKEVIKALGTSASAQEALLVANGVGAVGIAWMGWHVFANDRLPLKFGIKDPPHNTLPKTEPGDNEDEKCPEDAPKGKDAPLCIDIECKGKDEVCQHGKYKHCDCLNLGKPHFYYFNQDWLDGQSDALKYALKHMDDKPNVTCSDTGYDKAIAVDVSFINGLADKFCKGDSNKERHMTLAGKDISSKAYRKYSFDLTYNPPENDDDKCETDCAGAIKAMTASCEGLDSHSVQKGANVTLPCGAEYSYDVNIPDKPDDADVTCANKGDYSKAVDVDVSFFKRIAANFCGEDMSKDPSKDLASKDIHSNAYKGYKFHFEASTRRDCMPDCKDTFEKIAPKCQGIDSHAIQPSGSAEFACGSSFSYKIELPDKGDDSPSTTKPGNKLGELKCHGAKDFGDHADISPDFQKQYTGWACTGTNREESVMDENSEPMVWQTKTNDAPYYYSISWVKGCQGKKQNPWTPVGDQKFPDGGDQVTCTRLMRKDYTDCYNGGVGGKRDAGCLRYEFKAEYTK